ncbi:hypothetical protein ID866_8292 [Astraeus odoratus]|nr:hypothetical protein ID866_8292 [Astraeus odoratus]
MLIIFNRYRTRLILPSQPRERSNYPWRYEGSAYTYLEYQEVFIDGDHTSLNIIVSSPKGFTPNWTSTEIMNGEFSSAESDVWTVGMTIFGTVHEGYAIFQVEK